MSERVVTIHIKHPDGDYRWTIPTCGTMAEILHSLPWQIKNGLNAELKEMFPRPSWMSDHV
jgi:hypothetical protein